MMCTMRRGRVPCGMLARCRAVEEMTNVAHEIYGGSGVQRETLNTTRGACRSSHPHAERGGDLAGYSRV